MSKMPFTFLLLTTIMQAAHTIQFTQEQARSLSGVTPEAWRHWRNVVPHLASKRGKSARFSIGDIVALSVMNEAVQGLGVSVSRLAEGFDHLFRLCAAERPSTLSTALVIVTPQAAALTANDDRMAADIGGGPAVSIPCGPIVMRLSAATFSGGVIDDQPSLPFAPRIVGRAK
jgi:hypothetical protein